MSSKRISKKDDTDKVTSAKNVWVFFRSTYSTWLIFSLSLCMTFIAWTITNKSNQNHSQDLFTFEVAQTLQAIEQRMQGYQ
jgi:CHASE1-domain containing sensor protein